MVFRKRHKKQTLSLEQLEEKKLPQGTAKELKGEIDAIHAERKEQKRLRTRKKIAKRKQVVEGTLAGGWRTGRDASADEPDKAEIGEAKAGAKKKTERKVVSVKPLLRAAAAGDLKQLKALLDAADSGLTASSKDFATKLTALMVAAAKGQVKAIHWLLRRGAKSTDRDQNGDTALSFAAKGGHVRAIEVLLTRPSKTPARWNNDLDRAVAAAIPQVEPLRVLLAQPG